MAFQPRRSGRTGIPQNNQPVFTTNQAGAPPKPFNQNNQTQNFNSQQNQKQFQNQSPLPQPPAPPLSLMQQTMPQQNQQFQSKQDASATGKALQQMDVDEEGKKQKWKKGAKLPLAIKKKRMNQRLSKILTPKNALILLHEFKPGCSYKVQEQPGTNPPLFIAQVEHENTVLASGQGMSKAQAKNTAAENAIKAIVSQAMTQQRIPNQQPETETSSQQGDESMDEDGEGKDPAATLPWAGLASFAIYKMFTEWQNQGAEVPMARPTLTKAKKKVRSFKQVEQDPNIKQEPVIKLEPHLMNAPKAPAVKKELPANAAELHPSVLLNTMRPGIVAVEISRTPGPNPTVTMGYEVDGRMFTGVAGNKKDAKKEAAKAVVSALYGLQYPQPAAVPAVANA